MRMPAELVDTMMLMKSHKGASIADSLQGI